MMLIETEPSDEGRGVRGGRYSVTVRLFGYYLPSVGVVVKRTGPDLAPRHVAHSFQPRGCDVVVPAPPPQARRAGAVHVLSVRVEGDRPVARRKQWAPQQQQ